MKKLLLSLVLLLGLATPALADGFSEKSKHCDWWGGFVEAVALDRLAGKNMKPTLDQAIPMMAELGYPRDIVVFVVSAIYEAPLDRTIPRHQVAGDMRNTFYAGCIEDYSYDLRY